MPIYEYQCSQCHHMFELMQKINDAPVTQCPKCFDNTVVKLVSAAGFQLKGNGWYATDFKNKGKPDAPAAEKSAAEKSADTAVKPAAAKDSKD